MALIFHLSDPKKKILHAKLGSRNESYTVFRYELQEMANLKSLRRVTVSQAKWVRFPQGTESLCCPSDMLCCTEPVSALTRFLSNNGGVRLSRFGRGRLRAGEQRKETRRLREGCSCSTSEK